MEWLQHGAEHYPKRKCINEYTYKEVYHAVLRVAQDLVTIEDSRIGILSDNSVMMAVYVLASMVACKEVLLLNVHLKADEILNQLEPLHIKHVYCSEKRRPQVPTAVQAIPFHSVQSIMEGANPFTISEISRVGEKSDELEPSQSFGGSTFADNHIVAIMNTSATTGQFKSVPLRWGQIKSHVAASQQVLGVTPEDNWLMVLPLFHVSGLSILMRSLYNGTAITIMESYDEDRVLALIQSHQINMMSLVPTILKQLEPRIEHHNLRVILLGGEFIQRPLVDACIRKQLPIYKTYGMTETFSQSVTMSVLDHMDKIDSVGQPLPGMKIHIVNPDVDGIGEIHLAGPMVMNGYLNREPIVGDFNTDDIGYIDDAGYLFILNRRTDLIISGGENIYPKEIEDLIYGFDGVEECAVIPVEDPKWGQVPALFVAFSDTCESTSDMEPSVLYKHIVANTTNDNCLEHNTENAKYIHRVERLRQYMESHLAKYKVPKYICVMTALPRNGTGKIVRKELKQYLGNLK